MKPKRIILFTLVAGAIALVLTFGIYKHNQSAHDAGVRGAGHVWQYLAAARSIGDGERISPDDVMVVTSTSDQPLVGAFGPGERAKVIGRIVSYPMTNGMIFTESYLAAADSALGLPHKIPNGMRAVSIKTTEVNDLGGFLYPGVRVDVLVAVKGADRTPGRSLALVQNVTVLATGKQLTPDPTGKPTEASVVTVLVTPDQAQKIVLAEEEGAIYFSLRNGGDNEVTDTKPTLLTEIAGTQSFPPAAEKHESLASEAPFPPAGTPIVTVLGNQSVTQFFRGNLPINVPAALRSGVQNNSGVER